MVTYGQSANVSAARHDARFYGEVDRLFNFQTESMLCVPLKMGQRVLGAISVLNKHTGEDFFDVDESLLLVFAWVASIALARFAED